MKLPSSAVWDQSIMKNDRIKKNYHRGQSVCAFFLLSVITNPRLLQLLNGYYSSIYQQIRNCYFTFPGKLLLCRLFSIMINTFKIAKSLSFESSHFFLYTGKTSKLCKKIYIFPILKAKSPLFQSVYYEKVRNKNPTGLLYVRYSESRRKKGMARSMSSKLQARSTSSKLPTRSVSPQPPARSMPSELTTEDLADSLTGFG